MDFTTALAVIYPSERLLTRASALASYESDALTAFCRRGNRREREERVGPIRGVRLTHTPANAAYDLVVFVGEPFQVAP